jgi:hypothetical protein
MDYDPNFLFIRYQNGVLDYQAIVDRANYHRTTQPVGALAPREVGKKIR